jgi:hypothetical protein
VFLALPSLALLAQLGEGPLIVEPPWLPADSGASQVTLTSDGFASGSQVLWNGFPRETRFLNSYQLQVTLTAEDTARPSLSFLSVVDPARGEAVRAPSPFWVYVPLWNNHFVWDAVRNRLWVAVPERAGPKGRSVALLEPETGVVEGYFPTGAEPQQLALSGDSQYLYVSSPGRIYRFNTRTLTIDLDFPIPQPEFGSLPAETLSMQVVPGQPESMVVSLRVPGVSPAYRGSILFRGPAPASRRLPERDGPASLLGWRDANTLYGTDDSGNFYEVVVDASGLSIIKTVPGMFGIQPDCTVESGLLYCRSGVVVDPTKPSYVRSYPANGFVAVLPAADRIVFLNRGRQAFGGGPILSPFQVLRTTTGESVANWIVPLPGSNDLGPLTRWGVDGLAYRDAGFNRINQPTDRLYVFRITGRD